MSKTGIIILAAGNSTRLGRPKQLLPYKDTTLIGHIVTEALAASLDPVVVVTGAFADDVTHALKNKKIYIRYNPLWPEGMGSGIVAGFSAIHQQQPDIKAVIIAVCDQPHLSADLLAKLITSQAIGQKGIAACSYSDTIGTPVLFTHRYFAALATLSANEGAKKLLSRYKDDVALVPFPQGNIDIDTPEDWAALLKG